MGGIGRTDEEERERREGEGLGPLFSFRAGLEGNFPTYK